MLSEKRKRAIFHGCLHEVRKKQYGEFLENYFKEHEQTLMSLAFPKPLAEYITEDQLKDQVNGILEFILHLYVHEHIIPFHEQYLSQFTAFLRNLENLEQDIRTGVIEPTNISKERFREWRGAGVIISFERSVSSSERDIIVSTRHAHIVIWLMERLGDLASNCLDYMNKYEFYGVIAEETRNFIERYGDREKHQKRLMLYLVEKTKKLIYSWRQRLEGEMAEQ